MTGVELHARLGPSNPRWVFCPGSVREEAAYQDVSGDAAIDGTGSHLLLEMCLINSVRAEAYKGQIIGSNHHDKPNGWMVLDDRIQRVQMCLDYVSTRCKQLADKYHGCKVEVLAEAKSDPGGMFGRTDWWGTCDITIRVLNDHGCCLFSEVIDYKDGRGWVDEKDNTQLTSYLGGQLRPFIASGPELVRPFMPEMVEGGGKMTIVQPKTNPCVRSSDTTTEKLVDDLIILSDAARKTDDPDAVLVPDDKGGKGHCRWCKHRDNCEALQKSKTDKVQVMTTQIAENTEGGSLLELSSQMTIKPADMAVEKLAEIADARSSFEQFFTTIEEEIQRRIEAGEHVDGWAIQPGKGSNVWAVDKTAVAAALKAKRIKKSDYMPESLISPAQALKIDSLNDKKKEAIKNDLIVFKAGADKLTKVAKGKPKQDTETMFSGVSFINTPVVTTPVSFI